MKIFDKKTIFVVILVVCALLFFSCGRHVIRVSDSGGGRTAVAAVMSARIEENVNLVYCCTFQKAWNSLCIESGEAIEITGAPGYIAELNAHRNDAAQIPEEACVAMAGIVNDYTLGRIAGEVNKKFRGALSPGDFYLGDKNKPGNVFLFALIYRELLFLKVFSELDSVFRYDKKDVGIASFGIESRLEIEKKKELWEQVEMFHGTQPVSIFALKVKTRSESDEIVISNFVSEGTLEKTYKKIDSYVNDPGNLQSANYMSNLTIPKVDFDIDGIFEGVCGKPFANGKFKGIVVSEAVQKIRFKLNERGAVVYSFFTGTALTGLFPQNYVIDGPFFIYMKVKGASSPYFMVYIANEELLVKR